MHGFEKRASTHEVHTRTHTLTHKILIRPFEAMKNKKKESGTTEAVFNEKKLAHTHAAVAAALTI